MDDIERKVFAIIAKRLPAGRQNLEPKDRLGDLGIDSLAAVEMIFDLEEAFDIEISYNSNDARPELETVGQIVEAIKKQVAGNQ